MAAVRLSSLLIHPNSSMSIRTSSRFQMTSRSSKVKYHKLSGGDDGYVDAQFIRPPPKVPWKAICLATVLFTVGTILLVIGSLLFTGHIDVKYGDRMYPLLILGSLMFIPGFYHVRLAYYAWKGYKGYSFDDIPDFD